MDKRFLCLDFGLARIGTALSFGTLAEPLVILENNDQVLYKIAALIRQHNVTDLVVGISEKEMAEQSRKFGTLLQEKMQLPVHWQDETLSSVEVHHMLRQKAAGKKQHRGPIDHFAAAQILQRYLDDQNFSL